MNDRQTSGGDPAKAAWPTTAASPVELSPAGALYAQPAQPSGLEA